MGGEVLKLYSEKIKRTVEKKAIKKGRQQGQQAIG